MSLTKRHHGEKVHTRNITIATFAREADSITVEGALEDNRLMPHYTISGDKLPPDVVHHMSIRMRIKGPMLTIDELDVDMPCTPHQECINTRNSLEALIGLRIAPGFSSKVKKAVGGVKGCVHLTTLLLSMAPAAVQGYWANKSRKPAVDKLSAEVLDQYLVDTCRVWRRDGPLAQSLLDAADK